MNFQTLGDVPQEAEGAEGLPEAPPEGEPVSGEGEKKKPQVNSETLGLLGVLGVCGAVLAVMYLRNGPQSAGAADAPPDPAATMVTDFLNRGDEHVSSMWQALHATDKFVEKFRNYSARPQIPLGNLRTNPFRQTAVQEVLAAAAEPEGEGAVRRRRELERAEASRAAESLQLQSVLHGPRNACLINNTLYQQGEQVDGFLVEEITAGSVVVRRGAYRFELRIGR